ncbi:hypothetical protein LFL96_08645 [Paraburkholderia sp. D15]|uniref:hypothetical protein n=1 Tax=Paraburkholderia sp. D15 TaxID=2880218 RepID=UPI00247A3369|nr:hypothetical protein [Paraburkholderia sp. D15]WGS51550.1 hypothetical protein LFL96_08645 [Paraburkholderia sp. D15]
MNKISSALIPIKMIVGIALAYSVNVVYAQGPFSGDWKYVERADASGKPYSTFEVRLTESADGRLQGAYCFVTQSGNRIDCDPDRKAINITGRVATDGRSAEVHFYSFFGGKDGVAELATTDDELNWRVIQNPRGDFFYGPYKVKLQKEPTDEHRGERQVKAAKAYLYDQPSTLPVARTYVVKGDYVKLLRVSDDLKFWRVEYVSNSGAVIERWIDCRAIAFCP